MFFFFITVRVFSDGRTLQLNRTLKNNHLAEKDTTRNWNYSLAAEVGLLTRNVVIAGADDLNGVLEKESFGCRVLFGTVEGNDSPTRRIRVENVEFRHCGQKGLTDTSDPR